MRRWAARRLLCTHSVMRLPPRSTRRSSCWRSAAKTRRFPGGRTRTCRIELRGGTLKPLVLVDGKRASRKMEQRSHDAKNGLRLGAAVLGIQIHESEAMHKHYPGFTEGDIPSGRCRFKAGLRRGNRATRRRRRIPVRPCSRWARWRGSPAPAAPVKWRWRFLCGRGTKCAQAR